MKCTTASNGGTENYQLIRSTPISTYYTGPQIKNAL